MGSPFKKFHSLVPTIPVLLRYVPNHAISRVAKEQPLGGGFDFVPKRAMSSVAEGSTNYEHLHAPIPIL